MHRGVVISQILLKNGFVHKSLCIMHYAGYMPIWLKNAAFFVGGLVWHAYNAIMRIAQDAYNGGSLYIQN